MEDIISNYRGDSQDYPPLHVQIESLQARRAQLLLEQNELMKYNHINSSTNRFVTFLTMFVNIILLVCFSGS